MNDVKRTIKINRARHNYWLTIDIMMHRDSFDAAELHKIAANRHYHRKRLHDLCNPMELREAYSWLTANVLPEVENYLK